MPERTIKVSAAYYTNEAGQSVLGFQGDKVDVHADHVKRFDELNVLPERFIEEPKGMDDQLVFPGSAGVQDDESDGDGDDKPARANTRKR
ncbi:hypothetical protein [Mycobacterium asiaticum]|uniref:hypothetical protein n=1 Tax=Mycobacterium asiaticum TaxID=1790 RepID=UPI0007F032A3|nr:hypothetical protein [Mycobacterium asiaticum]OBJ57842.1 hypothetical protein A9W94_17075 [Mycobacterium asiaticum]